MVVADLKGMPSISFRRSGHQDTRRPDEGGVRSFMSGIVSPFTACFQPSISSCVPGCSNPSNYQYEKPVVVSPSVDRYNRCHPETNSPNRQESPSSCSSTYHHPSSPKNRLKECTQMTTDIEKPHSNDVLCGRGGSSNRHLGNMHFRELVAANKKTYVGLTKKQKMLVARKIVEMVHNTEPSGRFLAKDLDTGLWYDIGLPRSLEKTSQALREKNSNDFPQDALDAASDISRSGSPRSQCGSNSPTPSTEESTCRTKSTKNVEAPPLVIPASLRQIFGPKKRIVQSYAWPEYSQTPTGMDQSYMRHHVPHSPPSIHDDRYRAPPLPHGVPHHYDRTPPRSPPHCYTSSPTYRPREQSRHVKPPSYPPQDSQVENHDHFDYYQKHSRNYDHYGHPTHYHQQRHPTQYPSPPDTRLPPTPGNYRGYPSPVQHHSFSPAYQRTAAPSFYSHRRSELLHSTSSQVAKRHEPYRYVSDRRSPSHTHVPSSPPSPIHYRSLSNGCIRSKSEVSPERRQEWKRQRNENGVPRRLSETSLSNAVENSLSLEERVVGRERRTKALTSPSEMLQSRERRSLKPKSAQAIECRVEELSGLAALSTAAFLKLDES